MSLDECMQARKTHAHSFYLGIDDFVTLHAFQDMPIIRQRAFHVAPGTENQIPVTPTLYTTAPQVRNEYRFIQTRRSYYAHEIMAKPFFQTVFLTLNIQR